MHVCVRAGAYVREVLVWLRICERVHLYACVFVHKWCCVCMHIAPLDEDVCGCCRQGSVRAHIRKSSINLYNEKLDNTRVYIVQH